MSYGLRWCSNFAPLENIGECKAAAHIENVIDKKMIRYCRSTGNGYRSFLEEKKIRVKNKKGGESKKEGESNVTLFESERDQLEDL